MENISTNPWPSGWREHEQQQLERQARLTFAQKLQWLEDAHKMVLQMQKAQTIKDAPQTNASPTNASPTNAPQ